MQFAEDHAAAEFVIHSCGEAGIRVNDQDLSESFILLPGQPVQSWPVAVDERHTKHTQPVSYTHLRAPRDS